MLELNEETLVILHRAGVTIQDLLNQWQWVQEHPVPLEGGDMRDHLLSEAEIIKIEGDVYTIRVAQGLFTKDMRTGRLTRIGD